MSSTARSLPRAEAAKVVALNAPTNAADADERTPAPRRVAAPPSRFSAAAKRHLLDALPPLLAVAAIVGVWELLCAAPDASLPPPSRVVSETWDLIVDPFYDRGGIDKGLFWHVYASR